jgi:hypothetical protein
VSEDLQEIKIFWKNNMSKIINDRVKKKGTIEWMEILKKKGTSFE